MNEKNTTLVSKDEDEGGPTPQGSGLPPFRTSKPTYQHDQPQHNATDDPPGRSTALPATRAIAKLPAEQRQRLGSIRRELEFGKPWRIGCNDLADTLRASGLEFEEFLESVEHVAFYMRSENGAGIHRPRGWFMRRLAKGYF